MHNSLFILGAALQATAQFVPPPDPVLLTATRSGVLPVLPTTPFEGVETLQGAIIQKAPANSSYVPVNGPAEVQSDLPAATYVATLPETAFNELTGTVISGNVTGSSDQGASGVTFTINLSDLPDLAQYGPFGYHIHNMPVPDDGNCTSTLGHFDYTNAGEYYRCDRGNPQNCQTGDLAGKHGMIMTSPTFETSFVENYVSTDPNSPYFFGGLSVVIHAMNTTRLTCANFTQQQGNTGTNGSQYTTGTPSVTEVPGVTTSASTPSITGAPTEPYPGSATKVTIGSAFAILIAMVAVILL